MTPYRDALAWIHHHGFGEFARSAAPGVLEILRRGGVTAGRIVDIGCGSGIFAHESTAAGFDVAGFDASPSMIAIAKTTAPLASFAVAPLHTAPIPPCDAIVAMGEVLNHETLERVATFFGHAAAALRPGGILVFDTAEQHGRETHDERRFGGNDWSVIVVEERAGARLTRRVLSFRDDGEARSRDEEIHDLQLHDRARLAALLRERGFHVRVRRSYGTRRLPAGHAVFVAIRQPSGKPLASLAD